MARGFLFILTLLAFYLPPGVSIARDTPSLRSEVSKIGDLPKEAQRTLALIKKGGPFPYRRDGIVFGNFERRLPVMERGYYKEYTVPAPTIAALGESSPGATANIFRPMTITAPFAEFGSEPRGIVADTSA